MATKIKTFFWDKGVSGKLAGMLALGKKVNGEYRGIQPVNSQFVEGTGVKLVSFSFLSSRVDLIEFINSADGRVDDFKGFKLLCQNAEGESFYLQLGYRTVMFQALQGSKELRKAFGLKTKDLPSSSDKLDLKGLTVTREAVRIIKDWEYRLNQFMILEEPSAPLKSTIREVPGNWKELHTPTKWKD